jgi:thymidylate synthase (FAD)
MIDIDAIALHRGIKLVQPEATVWTQPQINHERFDAWKTRHGIRWDCSDSPTDPDAIIEVNGRLCYWAWGDRQHHRDNLGYLDNVLSMGHGSLFQHSFFGVLIRMSRNGWREFWRHNVGFQKTDEDDLGVQFAEGGVYWQARELEASISEMSQRYVDPTEHGFIMPADLRDLPDEQQVKWLDNIEYNVQQYQEVKRIKQEQYRKDGLTARNARIRASQAARSSLPGSIVTWFGITANIQALRWFCQLRGSEHAEWEIRQLAHQLLPQLKNDAPHSFHDMSLETSANVARVTSAYRKV